MKKRLDNKIFKLDERIGCGYYSDMYFNRTKEVLNKDNRHPILRMQVFQRHDDVCLCGVDEAIAILKRGIPANKTKSIKIRALHDGDIVNAWETVMTIDGDLSLFVHLQTVYLGALARGTKVATNVYRSVKAANGKPVLFFPARFDSHLVQAKDGYSYSVGRKAAGGESGGVSTDAQGEWWGSQGLGTIPHDLIAAYYGDTVKAALSFAEYMDPTIKRIVLVDFDNDCVGTTLAVAEALLFVYMETRDERYRLHAVRLDTSGTMVDRSVRENMDEQEYLGSFKPTGVNPRLVVNVCSVLRDKENEFDNGSIEQKFYRDIGIIVSGGFNPEKIKRFEDMGLPVTAYGVGSSLFDGNFDFTADIVQRCENGEWMHNAKRGRRYNDNPRLEEVG